MSTEWFCKVNDREVGPLTLPQIKSMADRGAIQPDDLLRRGETGSWLTAGKVKGLFTADTHDTHAGESATGKTDTKVTAKQSGKEAASAESKRPGKVLQAEPIPVGIPIAAEKKPKKEHDESSGAERSRSAKTTRPTPGKPSAATSDQAQDDNTEENTLEFLASTAPLPVRKSKSTPPTRHEDLLAESVTARSGAVSKSSGAGKHRVAEVELSTARRRHRKQLNKMAIVPLIFLLILGVVVGGYFLFRKDPALVARLKAEAARKAEEEKKKASAGLKDDTEDAVAPTGTAAVSATSSTASAGAAPSKAAAKPEWVDASKGLAEFKDQKLTVKIESAQFGLPLGVRAVGGDGQQDAPPLMLTISLENGDDKRKLDYRAWSAGQYTLKDDLGNSYRQIRFLGKEGANRSIYPGKPVQDRLFFERPLKTAVKLQLELPASAFDGKGMVRFEIPVSMITDAPATPPAAVANGTVPDRMFLPPDEAAAAKQGKPAGDSEVIPPLDLGEGPVKQTKTRSGVK